MGSRARPAVNARVTVGEPVFLAVDAGTSAVKAVLLDGDGTELAVARRSTVVSRPRPSWAEQDMTAVWAAVVATVREVLADREQVEFVAITAQGDGCWLIDETGAPTGPAILWNDGRASGFVDDWWADGTIAKAYRLNGSICFPGLPNAILRWLQLHQPERLAASARMLTCSGWLFWQLTRTALAHVSDASAPFLDARSKAYSPELLEMYGLTGIRRLLPPVADSIAASGLLHASAAAELGLPEDVPVFMAPYDVASAAIGLGATEPGAALAVLGTTIVTGLVTEQPVAEGAPVGSTIVLGLDGLHLRFFPALNGVEVLAWCARTLGLGGAADVAELAEQSVPGANGLLFLPYLAPAGERAPFLDSSARGSFWNLTLEHTRADIARAVLEGLTMVVVDSLAHASIDPIELRLTGGGARSRFWCRLIANATGVPVLVPAAEEVTARGAYLAARLAADHAVEGLAAAGERHEPDAGMEAFHRERYEEFCRVRELARAVWAAGREP